MDYINNIKNTLIIRNGLFVLELPIAQRTSPQSTESTAGFPPFQLQRDSQPLSVLLTNELTLAISGQQILIPLHQVAGELSFAAGCPLQSLCFILKLTDAVLQRHIQSVLAATLSRYCLALRQRPRQPAVRFPQLRSKPH
jgi:hypothetical protein